LHKIATGHDKNFHVLYAAATLSSIDFIHDTRNLLHALKNYWDKGNFTGFLREQTDDLPINLPIQEIAFEFIPVKRNKEP